MSDSFDSFDVEEEEALRFELKAYLEDDGDIEADDVESMSYMMIRRKTVRGLILMLMMMMMMLLLLPLMMLLMLRTCDTQ